jgi:hypothetical protein
VAGKPNFIYIGPDKAGSSWLHEVLLRHPQIFLSPAKDLYFFDRYYDRGLDWYLRQFDDARPGHLVVGEVCQDYLFHPEAPQRIADSLGSCRMMVTLRDPADRAFSSYLYMLRSGWEPGTFLQALAGQPMLLQHGSYATALERFTDRFGRDQIHVAVFDDLVADPQAFLDALTAWLDIESITMTPAQLGARLPATRARSATLSRLACWGAQFVREHDGATVVGRVKRSPLVQRTLYRPLTTDKPTMTAEERSAVQVALAEEVAQIDRVYGLDLARRWGWPDRD